MIEDKIRNPFSESQDADDDDLQLITESLGGDVDALERLIRHHQAWIYNIVLRMVYNPADAADITQEILIKVVTALSAYHAEKASFRTWLYRIVANHVISEKRSEKRRKVGCTNPRLKDYSADNPSLDGELADKRFNSNPDSRIFVEELKISCYLGALFCLNKNERFVLILGAILNINDLVGSEILGTTRANYRKMLSRGRKKLFNFMNNTCGLLNKDHPCRCSNKLNDAIDAGWLNPERTVFYKGETKKVKEIVYRTVNDARIAHYQRCIDFYRNQPFYQPDDFSKNVRQLIESDDFKTVFKLQ